MYHYTLTLSEYARMLDRMAEINRLAPGTMRVVATDSRFVESKLRPGELIEVETQDGYQRGRHRRQSHDQHQ